MSKPRDGFYKLYDSVNGDYVSNRIFSRDEAERFLMSHKTDQNIKNGDHYMVGNDDADTLELSDFCKR